MITRYATWLMGRDLAYSTAKARTQLGWTAALTYPRHDAPCDGTTCALRGRPWPDDRAGDHGLAGTGAAQARALAPPAEGAGFQSARPGSDATLSEAV